ncbi:MAG: hypothetical protein HZA63_15080 [Rhodocyclales bacterium]|nr:hypothetical protein [Rhodocyclales bacterium]
MTQFNAELAEQFRAEKYQEATERLTELEQKRLNDIFPTLDAVAIRVEAGDRGAMMELLAIVADSLRWFEALPQQTRDGLAGGLEKMRNNLEEARGFLPRKRGERSAVDKRSHETAEFFTAFAVEWARLNKGLSREDAVAKVEEEFGMTESLIHKRWKRHHRGAKKSLNMIQPVLERLGVALPRMTRRRKRLF